MMFYTDDPIADFNRHDAEQQERLDKLPICESCEEPIQDEYCYDLGGELHCEECFKKQFRRPVENYIGWQVI